MPEKSNSNLKVPFGLKGGRLHRPEEVTSGLACECICPACETKLVANQGKAKRAYFSHYRTHSCAGGYETAVHLMAKQVILDEQRIRIPALTISLDAGPIPEGGLIHSSVRYPERDVELLDVVAEKQQERWRPDLTATLKNGAQLHIEIQVTHAVGEEKSEALDNLMEVDLSKLDQESVYDAQKFSDEVVLHAERRWHRCSLYDDLPKTMDARLELEDQLARLREAHEREQQEKAELEKKEYHARMAQIREDNRRQAAQKLRNKDSYKSDALIRQNLRPQLLRLQARKAAYQSPPGSGETGVPVEGEWIFSVPRQTWQHFILNNFIPLMRIDQDFTASDVLSRVISRFPWPPEISEVMKMRHKLSGADAQAVPDPQRVVADYLTALAVNAIISFGVSHRSFTRYNGDRWSKWGRWRMR